MTGIKLLDRVTLPQPVALMFRDAFDLSIIRDGLDVRLTPLITFAGKKLRQRPIDLGVVPSGRWTAPYLKGVSDGVPGRRYDYLLEVEDRYARFLPLATAISLVARSPGDPDSDVTILPKPAEISPWAGWAGMMDKLAILLPSGREANDQPDHIPLFPQVARTAPSPRAEVRTHLKWREAGKEDRDAAYALLSVSITRRINGRNVDVVLGLGTADAQGAVAITFPYPALPSQTPAEAAAGRKETLWTVKVQAHFSDLAHDEAGGFGKGQRDIALILKQLNSAPKKLLARVDANDEFPDQKLIMCQPLILKSKKTETTASPYLIMQSA